MEAVCEAVPSLGLSGMATGVRGDRPTAETRARHVGEQPGGHGLRAAGARRHGAGRPRKCGGGGAKGRRRRWWWVVATESGVGEATKKHGERTESERVGSVPQISWKETNPHLERIFYRGANPTLLSSIQTLRRMGRLRPGWLKPSNQTNGKRHEEETSRLCRVTDRS